VAYKHRILSSRQGCSGGSGHYDSSQQEDTFDRYTANLWGLEAQQVWHRPYR